MALPIFGPVVGWGLFVVSNFVEFYPGFRMTSGMSTWLNFGILLIFILAVASGVLLISFTLISHFTAQKDLRPRLALSTFASA